MALLGKGERRENAAVPRTDGNQTGWACVLDSSESICRERILIRLGALSVCVLAFSVPALSAAQDAPPSVVGGRVAPAAHCLDARNMQQVVQADAQSVAIRGGDGRAFRITFAAQCPGVLDATNVRLEAPAGWACGSGQERVVLNGVDCAIAAVDVIDDREYAQAARESDRQYAATLPTVTVAKKATAGAPRHTFQTSPEYCFATRNVRSWSEDPEGVIVETNPRRNGGHRYYRVELGAGCILDGAHEIDFVSGFQNGLMCGNPGDRIALAGSSMAGGSGRSFEQRFARMGCPVLSVYPRR